MITAKEFAAATGISYPVVIRWIREKRIPAKAETFGAMKLWRIHVSQVEKFKKTENKPKRGRPVEKK